MSVPAIALYAVPPSIPDHDLNPNPNPSSSQKPPFGGLSYLFSSSPIESTYLSHDHHRADELSSSLSYSSFPSSFKSRDSSPISVFRGPGSSKTPPSVRNWGGRDRVLGGFVRNALVGSCLDYGSGGVGVGVGVGDVDEELTFDLEESRVGPTEERLVWLEGTEFLVGAQSRYKVFYEEMVVRAFYEAEKAHRGQMRASGDPYLLHCVETAELLARIGANTTVVAAGLLHDTLDDSFMNYDYISRMFGADVADLVKGVSKLSHLSKLARENNTASKTEEADRLHTMFLAMADARAVLIKLADRLHNMLTLEALPIIKQQRFAKETLEIFAPLANRLGIFSWKEQLENLCFKYLYPEQHTELSSKLIKSFDEAMIESSIEKLEQALKDEGVSYHVVSGRPKSLYSIYCKMLKKNLTMDEIHDIHGLRLIVDKKEDCYKALDVVHHLWPKLLGRIKDYIINPKFNGYQSLHTVVVGEDMLPLEVQIRTKEMHLQAEFGFAAHWRYKEGDCEHSSFVLRMVEWARWVVTWQCETMNCDRPMSVCGTDLIRPPCPFPSHSDDCPYSYTRQCEHDGPIFIIMLENEKMSVQELPPNSTMMDLLERAGRWSTRWNSYKFPIRHDLRPRLNRERVSDPNRILMMGDVVELAPAIPDKSLTEYREEIQRMYEHGLTAATTSRRAGRRC